MFKYEYLDTNWEAWRTRHISAIFAVSRITYLKFRICKKPKVGKKIEIRTVIKIDRLNIFPNFAKEILPWKKSHETSLWDKAEDEYIF